MLSLALKFPGKSAVRRATALVVSGHQARDASGHGFGSSRYIDAPDEGPKELYTEVEKSYAEWKYVEKILPKKYIPEPPKDPTVVYPSGWKPPSPPSLGAQYFIPRTKNHLVPVYLTIFTRQRGQRRWTRIKQVEGNIWALEADIGNYLKKLFPEKVIQTWVNESYRIVYIKGEYEEQVKDWVVQQGF